MRAAEIKEHPDGSAEVRVLSHTGNQSCATDRLRAAVLHDNLVELELEDAVLHARLVHGLTWDQVAAELGITRQAVQKRYAVAEQVASANL